MLIKDIVDFEDFFHKEFYKSKYNMRQLSELSGMSQAKITHWLDKIGPEVKFLDVLKMTNALSHHITVEHCTASVPATTTIPGNGIWANFKGNRVPKIIKKAKKSSKKGR